MSTKPDQVQNGKRGYNPCLDVDRFKEPDRKINAIDFSWVKKILTELPDDNINGAVTRCLAWTGMRPSQLNRLRRSDIDLAHATVWVPAAKGGRTNPIALPRAGVRAFRAPIDFAEAGVYLFADQRKELGERGFEQRNVTSGSSAQPSGPIIRRGLRRTGCGTRWPRTCSRRAPRRVKSSTS
jgi:integrase